MQFLNAERLIFTLAAELKSRGMDDEVLFLRRLYAQRRRHPRAWYSDDVRMLELACMLGVAPFECVFLPQPRYHRCPCWGQDRDRGRTQTKVFPASSNGPALTVHWCRTCGAHWVVTGDP